MSVGFWLCLFIIKLYFQKDIFNKIIFAITEKRQIAVLDWVLSGAYEFRNGITTTVNLSSTHVLKISVKESDINHGRCFQKVLANKK